VAIVAARFRRSDAPHPQRHDRELCTPFRLEPGSSERVFSASRWLRKRCRCKGPRNKQSLIGGFIMTSGVGERSTINITHHLDGMRFPASKDDLLLRARDNGAGQDTLEVLESFPEGREFETLADVLTACEQTDQVPQTGVIDVKP
jgi:Protein of unknown function (DUF2795)